MGLQSKKLTYFHNHSITAETKTRRDPVFRPRTMKYSKRQKKGGKRQERKKRSKLLTHYHHKRNTQNLWKKKETKKNGNIMHFENRARVERNEKRVEKAVEIGRTFLFSKGKPPLRSNSYTYMYQNIARL